MCVSLEDCVQWRPSQRTLAYEGSSTLGRLHKTTFKLPQKRCAFKFPKRTIRLGGRGHFHGLRVRFKLCF